MKQFLGIQTKSIDKKTAYGLLAANLILPGIGSILGGRKSGYFQVLLSLISLGATFYYGLKLGKWFLLHSEQVPDWIYGFPPEIQNQLWKLIVPIIYALILFIISLVWSVLTSISIIRQAKQNAPPKITLN